MNSLSAKQTFVATGVAIACMVDITRLAIYSSKVAFAEAFKSQFLIVILAITASFTGIYFGTQLLHKISFIGVKIVMCVIDYNWFFINIRHNLITKWNE
ncbi:MAG: hypothetical protein KA974_03490 [Saprospiraceae bacterium]|nr:hypothetical protein [Saprospiraceae bacterium]MBP7699729.1 hypothetical protein [Saprospiraceae bacterium]